MVDLKTVEDKLYEYKTMLKFEDIGKYIVIKTTSFLGSDKFAKIAGLVRELGGEYISAGKESHFRVPHEPAQATANPNPQEIILCPYCGNPLGITLSKRAVAGK